MNKNQTLVSKESKLRCLRTTHVQAIASHRNIDRKVKKMNSMPTQTLGQ